MTSSARMIDNDTIVAIATARGEGAIAIVRLSGSKAKQIALQITHKNDLAPRHAYLSSLYDSDDQMIDRAIVIYYESPKSFTGEDIVEFQTHGGIAASNALIDELIRCGARVAEAGEFTRRAALNGKISRSEVEATLALMGAKNKRASKLLARQLKGGLDHFVNSVRDALIRVRAYAEVSIDYAEDDIPDSTLDQMQIQLQDLENLLDRTIKTSLQREGLISGFKLAIIGKPNVGKSSLLNRLLSYDRAIVTDIAGTTRDTIEEEIYIGSHLIRIVDTAGIRATSDQVEKIGIAHSIEAAQEADLIVALFDNSRAIDSEDEEVLRLITTLAEEKRVIVAINKSDLASLLDQSRFAGFTQAKISTKESIDELTTTLEKLLEITEGEDDTTLVSARQIASVKETIEEIGYAKRSLIQGDLELFGYHCDFATKAISTLTKAFEYDELLDAMFGEFCLGK